jgi:murein DD-endopeptidase MepM/ murein hydrolase activator NlpD
MVEVKHADGVRTRYAHASELLVREGQVIEAGEAIARVGSTGHSTGPHVHFEVLVDQVRIDPTRALKAYGVRAEEPDVRGLTGTGRPLR